MAMVSGRVPGSVRWQDSIDGISINGMPPVGTKGPPETAARVWRWFGDIIATQVAETGVPAAILIAIICNEAAGGVTDLQFVVNARRQEPGYVSDTATPGRVSVGCCQTLLSTARGVLHRPELTSVDLTDPAISIAAAAACIAEQQSATRLDPVLVAAAYNAGGLYEDYSPANRWKLRCYPLGTGAYIDRFVAWYNDAKAMQRSLKAPPPPGS